MRSSIILTGDINLMGVEDVNVPAAILSHVDMVRADLIVVGTEGRSGFQRLMLGSVAERVLRKATVQS